MDEQNMEQTAPAATGEPAGAAEPAAPTGPTRKARKPRSLAERVELEALRLKAKNAPPYPYKDYDHKQERKHEGTVRMNDFERALLVYAAQLRRRSFSKFILEAATEAALAAVHERESV